MRDTISSNRKGNKMKRTIILLIFLLLFIFICIFGVVSSFAAENDSLDIYTSEESENQDSPDTPVTELDTAVSNGEAAEGSTAADDVKADVTESDSTENEAAAAEVNGGRKNIFAELFYTAKDYATEIFCAMTFSISVVLAYAYKKGLLPLVHTTLVSIGNSVSKIKEKTEHSDECTTELTNILNDRLNMMETLMGALGEKVDSLSSTVDGIRNDEDLRLADKENLSLIVKTQIDMLHDIFMTSALPQYQKDSVGARVAKMREALSANEKK